MTRVLVVEDEPGPASGARDQPARARVRRRRPSPTARAALAAAASHPPDVVVLDLGLPDMDGIEVIEGLRGWSQAPIIVLSARQGQGDKVVALDAGADDYVTKPFGMDELLARLRAALRRGGSDPDAPRRRDAAASPSTSPPSRHDAEGEPVRLTPTEWHLLEVLIRQRGQARLPAAAAPGGLGPGLRDRDQLPARLHGAASPQARARPRPSAPPDHRARNGLPIRPRVAAEPRAARAALCGGLIEALSERLQPPAGLVEGALGVPDQLLELADLVGRALAGCLSHDLKYTGVIEWLPESAEIDIGFAAWEGRARSSA